jgi:hypothetical protein
MTIEQVIEKYELKLIASYEYKKKLTDDWVDKIMLKAIIAEEQLIEELIEDLKKLREE